MVGLSVSYALTVRFLFSNSDVYKMFQITEVLNMAVRMLSEIETNIVSVERVKEYHQIPPEVKYYNFQHQNK